MSVPVPIEPDAAAALRAAEDDARRARELVACHNRLHDLIARDAPLAEVLDELARGIERYEPSVMPCVVLLNRESHTLHPGAGPSLPPEWLAAIDGVVIGPNIGSCGSAAWSGELAISEDVAHDPKWEPIRDFAISCGLRHCWSMPVKGADGAVLGTFALYGREPGRPQPEHLELMQDGARLAGIAIERHRTMEKLVHDARHDGLTGLPNRRAIFDQLQVALPQAGAAAGVAVLFVDLDGLKAFNDTQGHDRADEMIREIGGRLRSVVRGADFVGRFGGDEFVIIATGVAGRAQAGELAERLMETVGRPLSGADTSVVTASVGIALVADGATEVAEAIRQADSAMYGAKRAGGDGYRFYEGTTPARAGRRRLLADALPGAQMREEMRLVFQPISDLQRDEVVAVEALLRWDHPDLGVVSPAELIPVAEDSGLIVPLDGWVLREACEVMAALWRRTGRPLELAVNVSARQLGRPGFANSVRQTLAHARFPAELLRLEIAESALVAPDAPTARALAELDWLGIGIVLDGFGAGLSSPSQLKHRPVQGIKIDRSLVAGIPGDRVDRAIIAGVIGTARALECTVTAVGIETDAQREALRALGCARGQGFRLDRPLTAEALGTLLA